MLDFYIVILLSVLIASVIETRTCRAPSVSIGIKHDGTAKLLYWFLVIMLTLFAGLRTGYNDTWTYTINFTYLVDVGPIDWKEFSLRGYGFFDVYQQIIKTYVGEDPQNLIFLNAVLTTVLYMRYIKKHAVFYCGSIFLFLIGPYILSMGGMKQAIAIAIGLFAMDAYNERRYFSAVALFAIAFGFHPYVICLLSFLLLRDKVWDRKVMLVAAGCVLAFSNLEGILGAAAAIGKDYSVESFTDTTINPFRVIVESVPVVISFLYKNQINDTQDKDLILGTNMNIISFLFIAFGLFFNPMYMGRIALYFSAYSVISVPIMLKVAFGRNNKSLISGYYLLMGAYFLLDLTKLNPANLFVDQFFHISFSQFLQVFGH